MDYETELPLVDPDLVYAFGILVRRCTTWEQINLLLSYCTDMRFMSRTLDLGDSLKMQRMLYNRREELKNERQ